MAADVDTIVALGTGSGGFQSGATIGLDTSNAAGGTFTYGSAIANPNSGVNVLGLAKLGTGTLAITAASTYSGQTTISAGTLQLGTGVAGQDGSISSTSGVTNNAALVYNLSGNQTASYGISGSGSLATIGTGQLTLNAAKDVQRKRDGQPRHADLGDRQSQQQYGPGAEQHRHCRRGGDLNIGGVNGTANQIGLRNSTRSTSTEAR